MVNGVLLANWVCCGTGDQFYCVPLGEDKSYLRQAYTIAGLLGGATYLYRGLTSTWGIQT